MDNLFFNFDLWRVQSGVVMTGCRCSPSINSLAEHPSAITTIWCHWESKMDGLYWNDALQYRSRLAWMASRLCSNKSLVPDVDKAKCTRSRRSLSVLAIMVCRPFDRLILTQVLMVNLSPISSGTTPSGISTYVLPSKKKPFSPGKKQVLISNK